MVQSTGAYCTSGNIQTDIGRFILKVYNKAEILTDIDVSQSD